MFTSEIFGQHKIHVIGDPEGGKETKKLVKKSEPNFTMFDANDKHIKLRNAT